MRLETLKLIENAFNKTGEIQNNKEFEGVTKIFPNNYREFLNYFNGGNGNISDNSYLHLWSYENIVEFNNDYFGTEFITNVVLIGSDGGEMAYGINDKGQFIEVPFGKLDDDEVVVIAESFDGFVDYLCNAQSMWYELRSL